jgi:Major Facilitator Superfamily
VTAPPGRPAYADGTVLRWLAGYASSVAGDVVYYLALSSTVARVAGPATAGIVLALGTVPRALLMLGGGVLADRYGPRRVLVGSDLVRAALILAVAAATLLAGPSVAVLTGLALVFGAVDAVFMPAVGALPPYLVGPDELGRVQAMRSLAVRAANTAGPVAAAAALALGGAAAAFLVAGVLFSASLAMLVSIRTTQRPARADSAWADLRNGLRYLRGSAPLVRLVVVIGLAELCFSGPVMTGLVLLGAARGWSAAAAAWILAAFSVAGAAVGLLFAALRRVPGSAGFLAGSLVATALLVTAIGRAGTPPLAMVLGAALGITTGATAVTSATSLQLQTHPSYLGRVTAVVSLCTVGLSPVVYPVVGVVTAAFGAPVFFLGCGALCLVAAAVAVTIRPPRSTQATADPVRVGL